MKIQTLSFRKKSAFGVLAAVAAALVINSQSVAADFEHYDANYDGSISFTEYCKKQYTARSNGTCASGGHLCDEGFGKHLWNQFSAMDSNKNGSVTRSEFSGKGSAPRTPAPRGSAPKAPVSQGSAPKTPAPQGSAPKVPAPAPQGSAPKGSTPK